MEPKREQALVGVFVLGVAALLVATVLALTGAFSPGAATYRTYFKFAGGVEPGAEVRYAGGPKVGRVQSLRIDPKDESRIEIAFSMEPGVPIKTDSVVKILSISPLGENHVEVSAGSPQAPRARPGTALPSEPYQSFNEALAQINALGPEARQLLQTLNARATELKETVGRVNDLLNARNRANLAGTLADIHGTLAENRPKIKSTVTHLETASERLAPLLDDFKKTVKQADDALARMDSILGENRADLRQAVVDLRQTFASAASLTGQLDRTLSVNAESIDELLEDIRHTAENLKAFTETIKVRPAALIRSSGPKERRPGSNPK